MAAHRWTGYAVASGSVIALWVGGLVRARGSVIFLLALANAAAWVAASSAFLCRGVGPWRAVRRAVLAALLVGVPLAFNLRILDTFNLVKMTLLLVGVLALVSMWALEWAATGQGPHWRSGLHWPVLAVVASAAAASAGGLSPRYSVIGAYGTRDGLVSTLAYGVLVIAVIDAFRPADVGRLLRILWFGGGGLAGLYGLLQLADRLSLPGGPWDWLKWDLSAFPPGAIWSTLGNPNHLGAFAAVLLPLGVVCLVTAPTRREKSAVGLVGAVLTLELLHTGSAGAWLAAIAGMAAMVLLLLPELRARPRVMLQAAAGVTGLVLAGIVLVGPGSLLNQVTTAFRLQGASTTNQRLSYWTAGLAMAADRPVLGWGPDAYQLLFPRYQDADYVSANGPTTVVNGPHNLLIDEFVSTGLVGLAAFSALLAITGRRSQRAWRRFREMEKEQEGDVESARVFRLQLAGVGAAVVAHLVQASFNVAVVPLSFLFWFLLGLIGVLLAGSDAPADEARPRRARGLSQVAMLGVSLAVAAGALALSVAATAPYRADTRSFIGLRWQATANAAIKTSPPAAREALLRARHAFVAASRTNPWEATYLRSWTATDVNLARPQPRGERQTALRDSLLGEATQNYEKILALDGRSFRTLNEYAELLLRINELYPQNQRARGQAERLLEEAIVANPWQPRSPVLLSTLLERKREPEAAQRVVDTALARTPRSPDLLRQGARLRARAGDSTGAREYWRRLLVEAPGDGEATAAVTAPAGPALPPR